MSAVLGGALALGLVLVGLELVDVSLVDLLRDPSAVPDSPWWSGSISLVGLLLWGGAAGMLLLVGLVLRDAGEPARARFYLTSAAVVGWFALDDALLVHEEVLTEEAPLPLLLVLVLYGALAAWWALRFRRELARDGRLLAIVAGSFAASVLLDNANELPGVDVGYRAGVVEDYAKYVGLVALLVWALTVTRRELLAARRPARESADTLLP
jgi:hypothetical protein